MLTNRQIQKIAANDSSIRIVEADANLNEFQFDKLLKALKHNDYVYRLDFTHNRSGIILRPNLVCDELILLLEVNKNIIQIELPDLYRRAEHYNVLNKLKNDNELKQRSANTSWIIKKIANNDPLITSFTADITLTDTKFKQLIKALIKNKHVCSLKFDALNISESKVEYLIELLKRNKYIASIAIPNKYRNTDLYKEITSLIRKNRERHQININNMKTEKTIHDLEIKLTNGALPVNGAIEITWVSDDIVITLTKLIAQRADVTALNFSSDWRPNTQCLKSLSNLLDKNNNIMSINYKNRMFLDSNAERLAKEINHKLERNKTHKMIEKVRQVLIGQDTPADPKLTLFWVNDEIVQDIVELISLHDCLHITTLYLEDGKLSEASLKMLSELLDKCQQIETIDFNQIHEYDFRVQFKISSEFYRKIRSKLTQNCTLKAILVRIKNREKIMSTELSQLRGELSSERIKLVLNAIFKLELARIEKDNATLTELDYAAYGFSSEQMMTLFTILTKYPQMPLAKLNIGHSQMNKVAIDMLVNILKNHKQLTYLSMAGTRYLNDNDVLTKREDILLLVRNLKNLRLLTLDISGCLIDDAVIHEFSEALKTDIHLKTLIIDDNTFTSVGTQALTNALQQNKSLTRLSMQRCPLNKDQALSFITDIKNNHSLTDLTMNCHAALFNQRQEYYDGNGKKRWRWNESQDYPAQVRNKMTCFVNGNIKRRDKSFIAVRSKDKTELEKLLNSGVSPHVTDDKGHSLLLLAVETNFIPSVRLLLAKGANPYQQNQMGISPFSQAKNKDLQQIIALMQQDQRNISQMTSTSSTENNSKGKRPIRLPDISSFFSSRKRQKTDQPSYSSTVIDMDAIATPFASSTMLSSSNNQLYLVAVENANIEFLRRFSINNVDMTDGYGRSVLTLAVLSGSLESVELILSYGPNIEKTDCMGRTALHHLCLNPPQSHFIHILDQLLTKTTDINRLDHNGIPVLYYLVGGVYSNYDVANQESMRAEAVRKLLVHGANPNLKVKDLGLNIDNMTALHQATMQGLYEIVKALLQCHTCDRNAKDGNNDTPLHHAVRHGHVKIVKRLLIERGLDPRIINNNGDTPYDIIKQKLNASTSTQAINYTQISSLLENHQKIRILPAVSGIYWVRQFKVYHGELAINSDDVHAGLQQQVSRKLKKLPADKKMSNIAVAKLRFIVSGNNHQLGQKRNKRVIDLDLDFVERFHTSYAGRRKQIIRDDEEVSYYKPSRHRDADRKQWILDRFAAAPNDAKARATSDINDIHRALNKQAIEQLYNVPMPPSPARAFEHRFHHSEGASLFDHLEDKATISLIISRLQDYHHLIVGWKIYGIIMNVGSRYYMCPDCEIATLGEQSAEKSKFLINLKAGLQEVGCIFPKRRSLPMVTLFSAQTPCSGKRKQQASDHDNTIFDMRTGNNVILSKDPEVCSTPLTSYHSSRP